MAHLSDILQEIFSPKTAAQEARRVERELKRRLELGFWGRRKEDCGNLLFCTAWIAALLFCTAAIFGVWGVGAWTITEWIKDYVSQSGR